MKYLTSEISRVWEKVGGGNIQLTEGDSLRLARRSFSIAIGFLISINRAVWIGSATRTSGSIIWCCLIDSIWFCISFPSVNNENAALISHPTAYWLDHIEKEEIIQRKWEN